MISQTLRIADTRIELLESPDRAFLGLGRIIVAGVRLRDGAWPITVRLDTPDGILYPRLEIQKIRRTADRIEIDLHAIGLPWERGEYHDDYAQSVVWLRHPQDRIVDRLTLTLRPAALTCGGRAWTGFCYEFAFASAARKVHRLLTHATWEIGGRITGNTVLHQGQCNRPVYTGAISTLFTTACLRTLDRYGKPQGNSFQLGPRAGLLQGFDFQYSKAGALLQWWPRFESISSLVESPPGSDRLHIIDEYRFPLARRARTLPKQVLFSPGPLAEHEARDLWRECFEHVYGRIRRQYGVARTLVVPEVGMAYHAFLDKPAAKTPDQPRLRINIAGVVVDPAEAPYAIADHLLPTLARQGIRRFMPEPFTESDVTVWGMTRKLDNAMHGDLHVASVCATHRYFPSEFWGGIKAWRYMYRKGHSLGMQIGHWFSPHFSPRSAMFKEHPEYRMIDALGFPAGGGYGFDTLNVADWNTGVFAETFADLRRWKRQGGLDYLFVDSYSNLGLVQMNFAAAMRTNYTAFARLLAGVQKIGIRSLSFECIGPFGAGRFGVADLRGDLQEQNRAVAGQNDFGWWVGNEDMAVDCWLAVSPRKQSAEELEQIQFRAVAHRAYVAYQGLYDLRQILPAWWVRLNHLYNQALPHMQGRRRLLPDGAGVRWENGDGDLVWTFKDWRPQPAEAAVEFRRLDGKSHIRWRKPVLPAWNVFRLVP